ncbi:MAG: hypothetical protein JNL61_10400 [Rhizobiaceae bacterium]|nr:hypothetical protein [Rhizobiaceae bacterium]
MIKTALVTLTVIGCDCDGRLCEFISETPPTWQTVAECEAAAQARITTGHSLDYPLITSICRETVSPEATASVAGVAAAVPASKAPDVEARPQGFAIEETIADGGAVVYRWTAAGYVKVVSGFDHAAGRAVDFLRRSADRFLPASLLGD